MRQANILTFLFLLFQLNLILGSPIASSPDAFANVKTKSGEIRGSFETTFLQRRRFYSFKGIPYAKSPVNALRFKAPEPVEPWTGILNTTEFSAQCLQTTFNLTEFMGEENCLFLNVFTPNLTPNEKFAVIFYIHGGGYMSGSGSWMGPEILLDEDIVLVTFNYRLGPFGFLSLNSDEYAGNMGLKDQLLALKWINENVEYFGGDREKITIFGQSSGASAAHLHSLSPSSKNLYKRLIASSGSMLNPWSYSTKNHTEILSKIFAKETNKAEHEVTVDQIVDWLKNVNGHDFGVLTFSPVYESGECIKEIDLVWAPTIEKDGNNAIFTKPISEYLKEKTDIDSLFGYTSAESIILAPIDINHPDGLKTFDDRFEIQLPLKELNYSYFSDEYNEMVTDIRKYYFGDKLINRDTLAQFVKLLTDVFFIYGIDKSAKIQAKRSTGKTFYYQFSVDLELNYLRKTANASTFGLSGATHIEDMLYLFKMNVFVTDDAYDSIKVNSREGQMIKNLSKFITNFARFGDPSIGQLGELKAIDGDTINYVDITNNGFMTDANPHADYIRFWDDFLEKYKDQLKRK